MFERFCYFPNEDRLLPNVKIEETKFEDYWGKLGAEFKLKFLTMLPVTPCYIVIVSCPDYRKLDEIQQLQLPLRSHFAAKQTSLESW